MDSSRFPGKALASETGLPLVVHVMRRALAARTIDRVLVAAPDQAILDAVHAHGGEAILTRHDHLNGTSRIAEAVEHLDPSFTTVVNVQGDEPELEPTTIDAAVEALHADPDAPMATIASPIVNAEDFQNPNIVKVVLDPCGRALYFSRAAIPADRDGAGSKALAQPLRHVGLYAYERTFLPRFLAWAATPLETTECLEQLRVLEHGCPIAVAICPSSSEGIDTPEQYTAFVNRTRAADPA